MTPEELVPYLRSCYNAGALMPREVMALCDAYEALAAGVREVLSVSTVDMGTGFPVLVLSASAYESLRALLDGVKE